MPQMVKSSGLIEWWLDSDIYCIVLNGKGAKQTVWGATGICRSVGWRRLAVSFFLFAQQPKCRVRFAECCTSKPQRCASLGHEYTWRSCRKMSRGWVVTFEPLAALPPKREPPPHWIGGRVGPGAGPDGLEKRRTNSIAFAGNWSSICRPFRSWPKPAFKPHDMKSCGCWRNTSTHS